MSFWELYFLMRADSIKTFMLAYTIFGGICSGIASIGLFISIHDRNTHKDDKIIYKKILKSVKVALFMAIVFIPVNGFLPSTKQLAALIVVPKIINVVNESEAVKKIPGKLLNLADDWIDELSPEKKEK